MSESTHEEISHEEISSCIQTRYKWTHPHTLRDIDKKRDAGCLDARLPKLRSLNLGIACTSAIREVARRSRSRSIPRADSSPEHTRENRRAAPRRPLRSRSAPSPRARRTRLANFRSPWNSARQHRHPTPEPAHVQRVRSALGSPSDRASSYQPGRLTEIAQRFNARTVRPGGPGGTGDRAGDRVLTLEDAGDLCKTLISNAVEAANQLLDGASSRVSESSSRVSESPSRVAELPNHRSEFLGRVSELNCRAER